MKHKTIKSDTHVSKVDGIKCRLCSNIAVRKTSDEGFICKTHFKALCKLRAESIPGTKSARGKGKQQGESMLGCAGSSMIFVRSGIKRRKGQKRLGLWQFLSKKAKELRGRPTAAEVIFERKLKELHIKYKFQYPFLYAGIGGISDFYLFEHKLLVEIDGGYHLTDNQKQTDDIKDFICNSKLKKSVLRLTNKQAMYLSIEQIRVLIENKVFN